MMPVKIKVGPEQKARMEEREAKFSQDMEKIARLREGQTSRVGGYQDYFELEAEALIQEDPEADARAAEAIADYFASRADNMRAIRERITVLSTEVSKLRFQLDLERRKNETLRKTIERMRGRA